MWGVLKGMDERKEILFCWVCDCFKYNYTERGGTRNKIKKIEKYNMGRVRNDEEKENLNSDRKKNFKNGKGITVRPFAFTLTLLTPPPNPNTLYALAPPRILNPPTALFSNGSSAHKASVSPSTNLCVVQVSESEEKSGVAVIGEEGISWVV